MSIVDNRIGQNTLLKDLKCYLSCSKKHECDQNCCNIACIVLKSHNVPNAKLIATQILAIHDFEFTSDNLNDRNLLLAFLQIEKPKKILAFLENVDIEVLTQFNIMELDLIVNRLKKSFNKDSELILSKKNFCKLWSCLYYIEVDTWKNWRVVFLSLLELRRDPSLTGPDYKVKLFNLIHPVLPWTLKIKYQALAVLLSRVPNEHLIKTFPEISIQLVAALKAQEMSTVTGDLVLAYCMKFIGFWEDNNEFHQLFKFLFKTIFHSEPTIRNRVKTLWLSKLLACFELKGFFEKLNEICFEQDKFTSYITESTKTWSLKEQQCYGILLMNKMIDNKYTEELKNLCLEWALFSSNSEICLMAITFLRKHKEHFDENIILKTILINFDSGNQDISTELVELFKENEFSIDFYNVLFKWMNTSKKLFYTRQTFLLSILGYFSTEFFQQKIDIFRFLSNISYSSKYNVKELIKILITLSTIYPDDIKGYWRINCPYLRNKKIEDLILFQQYCKRYNVDYFEENIPDELKNWQITLSSVKKIVNENENILKNFGSSKLGESIQVTSVIKSFTVENGKNNDKSIKLNENAVKKEKREFIEPLIFNCTQLTMTLKNDVESAKSATMSIAKVILRVKNKKIIDKVSDLFLEYLIRLKSDLAFEIFEEIWIKLYELTMDFYEDEELDCRSLSSWRILLALLEVYPEKYDETMMKLLNLWTKLKNETLIIRIGKAIKALISSSKFDSSKYYVDILKHSFESCHLSFPISSNMGHLIATIYSRIFPQEPTLVMMSTFLTKYPKLFDVLCDLFLRGAVDYLNGKVSERGLCQIVGFFQKMFAVQLIDYSENMIIQRKLLIATMKRLINDRNYYLRNAIIQCLCQLGFDENNGKQITLKPILELKKMKQELRSCKLMEKDNNEEDTVIDVKDFKKINNVDEQLNMICKASRSNSIYERRKAALFIAKKDNLNPIIKLIGLIIFANDEIEDVGNSFQNSGFMIKPWMLLMNHIIENKLKDEEIKLAIDLINEGNNSGINNLNNHAFDETIYDRILLLKKYC